MAYRMVAIDLDGTLLTDDKRISERNLAEIRRVLESGAFVIISTGRAWPGAEPYVRLLEMSLPVITSNGSMIVDSATREILFRRDLTQEAAETILAKGRKRLASQVIWSGTTLYGLPLDEHLADYGRRFGKKTPLPMPPMETLREDGISKILWYDTPEHINAWETEVRGEICEGGALSDVTVVKSQPEFLEFFHAGVSKAKALASVTARFGIAMEETVAIGDADNDIPMLKAAGYAVAMGNGSTGAKSAAAWITDDNEHDGVAKALSRLFP